MIVRRYIAVLLLVSCSPIAGAGNVRSQCGREEQVVFNCTVGRKTLSLCMSGSAAGARGYMQYRFGPLNRPELIFPKAFEPPAKNFFFSSTGYSGGGEAHVRFSIGTYDYVMYSKITSGPPNADGSRDKDSSAGVIIRKDRKEIAHLQCAEKDADFVFPDGLLKEEEFEYLDTP